MSVIRQNVMTERAARDKYIQGVLALKAEHLGTTTADIGIAGPAKPVSTYDLFIVWHHLAMGRLTPPTQGDRNAAHSGPAFLPWHRFMLILLELQMQRVLGDKTVGLPYWDWASDGDLPANEQTATELWSNIGIGGSGSPVADGPFTPNKFRVEIESGPTGALRSVNRGLRRELALDAPGLPTTDQMDAVLSRPKYDESPWDRTPAQFRNEVEGWFNGPQMHNLVHVWVGGDMGPATSPNDPVFYLNHCNVDRLWEAWMGRKGRTYAPPASAPASLAGHRLNDALYSLLISQKITPAQMLDASRFYTYDKLP